MATRTRKAAVNGAVGADDEEKEERKQKQRYEDLVRRTQGHGIVLVSFTLRGHTDVLMNKRGWIKFPEVGQMRMKGDDLIERYEAERKKQAGELDGQAYWIDDEDHSRGLGIPYLNLRRCVLDGAKGVTSPFNAGMNLETLVGHAVRVEMQTFPLFHDPGLSERCITYKPHWAPGKNPGSWKHQGVNIVRPCIEAPWYLRATFRVDLRHFRGDLEQPSAQDVEILRVCLQNAGDAVGLGDWREDPSNGPMGKFEVYGALEVQKVPRREEGLRLTLG